ncbi:MAG: molybdate ABC transporter permease subunit [Alphaproteobacteria bacterium]|jgi:molybdate transport system permease protein
MEFDFTPIWLTLKLAATTVLVLMALSTPLAWWMARTGTRWVVLVESVVALPLVLPPTVLGFYLLILLGPEGWVGAPWVAVTDTSLVFSFAGLVIASVIYSLPFAVQPLHAAFESIGRDPIEAAYTLGATPRDAFFTVACPMAARGFLTASVLSFAHTIGEFGVVLMVGGAIPGETKVISVAIFESVETLNYPAAHWMSGGLLVFSFVVLVGVYALNRRFPIKLS